MQLSLFGSTYVRLAGDGAAVPLASEEALVDVLACRCGDRRSIVADISERNVVVAILAHLGRTPFAPPSARARSAGFDAT